MQPGTTIQVCHSTLGWCHGCNICTISICFYTYGQNHLYLNEMFSILCSMSSLANNRLQIRRGCNGSTKRCYRFLSVCPTILLCSLRICLPVRSPSEQILSSISACSDVVDVTKHAGRSSDTLWTKDWVGERGSEVAEMNARVCLIKPLLSSLAYFYYLLSKSYFPLNSISWFCDTDASTCWGFGCWKLHVQISA